MVPAKTPNSSGVATAFILRTTRVVEATPEPPDYLKSWSRMAAGRFPLPDFMLLAPASYFPRR